MPQLFVGGLHVVPHSDGTVAIGSTSERDFDQATSTDTQLDQLIDTARQSVPALRDAPVLERWAGVRPRSKSRAPVMGRWPGRTGHFISNGGFKIGFGMAPGMARVMADLVLDGQDVIPDDFRFEHLLSG
jgi:glycine oxidase